MNAGHATTNLVIPAWQVVVFFALGVPLIPLYAKLANDVNQSGRVIERISPFVVSFSRMWRLMKEHRRLFPESSLRLLFISFTLATYAWMFCIFFWPVRRFFLR